MTRFEGGSTVPGGYYWNTSAWSVGTVCGDEGTLEGSASDRFVRLPLVVMLALVVSISFGYAMFLPFIGFALFGQAIATKLTGVFTEAAADVATTLAPEWQPGEAHFAGAGDVPRTLPFGDRLSRIEAEIEALRAAERRS